MADHPDTEKVLAFLETLSDGEGRGVLLHLLSCRACARLVMDVIQGQRDGTDWGDILRFQSSDPFYERMTSAFEKVWGEHFADAEAERRESARRLRKLLSKSPRERERLVRDETGFRSWAVADLALEAGASGLMIDPLRGREQIELGLRIADSLDPEVYGDRLLADLETRGRSLLGESHRRMGDLFAAERAFHRAEASLERSVDPAETARYQHLLGLLRRDQERRAEALHHLDVAESVYLEIGDRDRAARPLASRALMDLIRARLEEAVAGFRKALDRIDEDTESLPHLLIRYHLSLSLLELERFPEARKVCVETAPLFAEWPRLDRDPRVVWLRGLLAVGTGNPEGAVVQIERVRDMLRTGVTKRPYVLASLDLAGLYLQQNRFEPLEEIVAEIETCSEAPRLTGGARHAVDFLKRLRDPSSGSRDRVRRARSAARAARLSELQLGDPI